MARQFSTPVKLAFIHQMYNSEEISINIMQKIHHFLSYCKKTTDRCLIVIISMLYQLIDKIYILMTFLYLTCISADFIIKWGK